MEHTSVLVVGAGPTGLTLACCLLQEGVAIRIVDQAVGPATASRALGLQIRGAEVLDRVGALADIPDRALKALNAHIDADGTELTLPIGRGSADGRQTMFISQAEIEAELRRRLTELGGHVEWATELVDICDDGDGVVATVRYVTGDRTLRSDWLVGTDGANSATRRLSGIGFPGTPLYDRMLLADVHVNWGLDRDGTSVWIRDGELFAVIPLPGSDDWRLFTSIPEDFPEHASTDVVIAAFAPKLRRFTGYDAPALKGVGWTSVFRINRRLADTYRKGRIFLAGDAAHIHSPLGGQGMNTGIGDAENLAWKLALVVRGAVWGSAADRLLDSYQAERRPQAEDVLKSTTGALDAIVGRGLRARLTRAFLFPLTRLGPVQRRMWYGMSQLGVSYRAGPLAPQSRLAVRRGLRPGDRVPDIACQTDRGEGTRLYVELRGHWAALAPDWATADDLATSAQQLGIPAVALGRADSRHPPALLVRPDGHLGWRGTNGGDMVGWLQRCIVGEKTPA
jgi:4,5-epoxidase